MVRVVLDLGQLLVLLAMVQVLPTRFQEGPPLNGTRTIAGLERGRLIGRTSRNQTELPRNIPEEH